ncbi:hypothetical protein LINPERPRIM_LOCUS3215 [Linum perenne]
MGSSAARGTTSFPWARPQTITTTTINNNNSSIRERTSSISLCCLVVGLLVPTEFITKGFEFRRGSTASKTTAIGRDPRLLPATAAVQLIIESRFPPLSIINLSRGGGNLRHASASLKVINFFF